MELTEICKWYEYSRDRRREEKVNNLPKDCTKVFGNLGCYDCYGDDKSCIIYTPTKKEDRQDE